MTVRKSAMALTLIPLMLLLCGAGSRQSNLDNVPGGQPAGERAAQALLPKSQNPLWLKFLACKVGYDDHKGLYNIAVTPDVRAMAGKTVTINGFVLPLDASDHTGHFLLTRNTPVCMYCPPGEPNEVVEIVSPRRILWTDKIVTVTGPLSLINNGENGVFFKIIATKVQ